MIKINLVPVKEKKKRKEFFAILSVILALVFVLLVMVYFYVQRWNAKNDLSRQIKDVEQESQGYQDKINEVKDLEAKEASLEVFKKTIKGISETQRKIIVAIDQMGLNLPEGVWLTNIDQGRGGDGNKFTIQGYAFTESNLQTYYSNIQKQITQLKEFSMDEKTTGSLVGNNKLVHQFTISFKVMDQGT